MCTALLDGILRPTAGGTLSYLLRLPKKFLGACEVSMQLGGN